jgi:hypothetical protein
LIGVCPSGRSRDRCGLLGQRCDRLLVEFALPSGKVHVVPEKPHFADKLKLKAVAIGAKETLWTDSATHASRSRGQSAHSSRTRPARSASPRFVM